jgi:hypothetical protein
MREARYTNTGPKKTKTRTNAKMEDATIGPIAARNGMGQQPRTTEYRSKKEVQDGLDGSDV